MKASIAFTQMASVERSQLADLETTIERGLTTFVEVGTALATIRDSRLYRDGYATFEEYCRARWGMTRQAANRLVAASEVATVLEPTGSIPTSERQVRPLVSLEPDEQREAWGRANEIAEVEGTRVRARHVEQAVKERKSVSRGIHFDGRPPAESLIQSWRDEYLRMKGIVEDTIADKHPASVLATLWAEAAEPMIHELKKFNRTRR